MFRPSDKHVDNSFMSKLCIGTYYNNLIVMLSDQEEEKWLSCCRSLDRGTGATKYYSNSATVTWRRVDKIRNSYASRLSRVFNSIISIQNIQKIPILPQVSLLQIKIFKLGLSNNGMYKRKNYDLIAKVKKNHLVKID